MKKGFTLIELLIVLAIIGTLVAMAVVRFAGLASDRDLKVCRANLRSLNSAISVYRIEEGAWPYDGSTTDLDLLSTVGYVLEIPVCPGGGTYTLSNVIASDYDRASCNLHALEHQ